MLRRHRGRPGTVVLPAAWALDHQPVADATHRGLITLRKPGGTSAWSEVEQQTVTQPHRPYVVEEPCRVVALRATTVTSGEDDVTVAAYQISMSADVSPEVGDLGRLSRTGDPLLDGREVRLREVVLGTELFERVVLAELND